MERKSVFAFFLVALFYASGILWAEGSLEKGKVGKTPGPGGDYKSIVVSVNKDAPSLGPLNGFGSGTDYTRNQAFETLCNMDADKVMEFCIAKDIVKKGKGVYDIHIYDYVTDIAGNPLSASDVVYCFDNAIESGYYSSTFSTVDNYKVLDDYTVELTFGNERVGQLEGLLCSIAIYTRAAYEGSGDKMAKQPIGTKPYKLTEAVSGSYYTYEKTDNYWQKDPSLICSSSQSNVDKVTLTVITDQTTEAIALTMNEIDKPSGIALVDYKNFINDKGEALPGYTAEIADSNKVFHLVFNSSDNSPCGDINLRKAIAYCVDAAGIAANQRGSMAYIVEGGLSNRIWLDYDPSWDDGNYYNFSLEKAKSYLAKSNYKGQSLNFVINNNSDQPTIGTFIQAYCLAAGIDVKCNVKESAVYNTILVDPSGTQFDILLGYVKVSSYYSWSANYELDINAYDGKTNLLGIYDPTLQKLYDASAGIETASLESTKALLDYTEEKCYLYGLYANKNVVVTRDKIKEMVLDWNNNIIPGACTVIPDEEYGS